MNRDAATGDRLKDQVVVIVGGTSGIGLSASQACIAEGGQVVVIGRDPSKAEHAEQILGSAARFVVGDAAQASTVERAIQVAVRDFGALHGLYHVAGGSGRRFGDGPLHEATDEGWSATFRLNLDALFYSNRAAVRQFLAQGQGGAVLNMTSVLATSPAPAYFATHAYAAAKAAVIGLTRSAAAYYAKDNIRINALAPALVETPMAERALGNDQIMQYIRSKQPLDGGRAGRASDLDEAAIFFLSNGSQFATGQVLAVDGGWTTTEGQLGGHK